MGVIDEAGISSKVRIARVACPHDCPDGCSMLVSVDNASGRAIKVVGDPTHPVTRGYLCNKVNNYLDLVYNDKRVLYPHRRVGRKGPEAKFVRIGWDEALAQIATRLKGVIAQYGAEAVQPFSYSGTLGMLGFFGMGERFFNKMGAARLERTICTAAGAAAEMHTFGRVGDANIEDLPQMKVVILWGTNLVSTGVHAMPFVTAARDNGAQIIAIDPRVTRTTAFADWHLQPRPGTDAALVLGMMKIIVDRGLHDQEFLERNTIGWEQLLARLPEYSLQRVESITGIPAADIEKLALLYGGTRQSFIRLNWGIQRHDNGGMMTRAIKLLPVVTGAMRGKGGVCMSTGGEMRRVDMRKLQATYLLEGRTPRTINMIQLGNAINDPALDPPVKALFCWSADPANCVPDTVSARKGLAREDLFTVVHDTFWSDTAAYADIVLPADAALEHVDLLPAYGNYYYSLSEQAIEKQGESLDNQEMFRRLAKAMGYHEPCFSQSDEDMIRDLMDPQVNPLFEGITYERLKRDGWARANVDSPRRWGINSGKWPTPSGRIEIYSQALAKTGVDPLPMHVPEQEGFESIELKQRFPLQVISAATHYFIGASFQHVPPLQDMLARPTFEVSVQDAKTRGIEDGDYCRLFNDRGETFGYALIVEGLLTGVLGAQKQLQGSKMPGGVNINALTSQREADMGRGPVFFSTLAQLEKA